MSCLISPFARRHLAQTCCHVLKLCRPCYLQTIECYGRLGELLFGGRYPFSDLGRTVYADNLFVLGTLIPLMRIICILLFVAHRFVTACVAHKRVCALPPPSAHLVMLNSRHLLLVVSYWPAHVRLVLACSLSFLMQACKGSPSFSICIYGLPVDTHRWCGVRRSEPHLSHV
jgi:hypothetical protein